jgi:ubiquinone/menaquinone biosynthesis C-methylase UbiE
MSEIQGTYDIHDPSVMAVIDDLPLWSAPFGLKLLEVARLGRGLTVLDVGSGAGFPVVELSQRLGASCRVFGVDPWPEAVARAREKIRTWGITNLQIVDGTAEALPFGDATFDLVVSNNGTNNVDDEERAFAEIVRVAKPGAQVAFTVNLPDTMVEFYTAYRTVLRRRGLEDAIARVDRHIAEKRKPLEHHRRLARGGRRPRGLVRLPLHRRLGDARPLHHQARLPGRLDGGPGRWRRRGGVRGGPCRARRTGGEGG